MLHQQTGSGQISPLQGDAWAAWNASYHETGVDEYYRAIGEALYRQARHEQIEALFARLDEQNEIVDAVLQVQGLALVPAAQ